MNVYCILLIVTVHVARSTSSALIGCGCDSWESERKATSCQDIVSNFNQRAESGVYALVDSITNEEYYAYCDMSSPCGGKGWTKIADVNMGRLSQECPEGLTFNDQGNIRTCARNIDTAGCSSTHFSSHNIQYSEVCGRVLAYQYGSTDAFGHDALTNDIDSHYVDGVSITRGSPRRHIWTFAASLLDTYNPSQFGGRTQCPCSSSVGDPNYKPDFIGDDYYCESGAHGTTWELVLYSEDPLFDNRDCGPLETECCNRGLLPYFYKDIGKKTVDDLEFRICADQGKLDEDTHVSVIELFIR